MSGRFSFVYLWFFDVTWRATKKTEKRQ